jgi:hypothetical protein
VYHALLLAQCGVRGVAAVLPAAICSCSWHSCCGQCPGSGCLLPGGSTLARSHCSRSTPVS